MTTANCLMQAISSLTCLKGNSFYIGDLIDVLGNNYSVFIEEEDLRKILSRHGFVLCPNIDWYHHSPANAIAQTRATEASQKLCLTLLTDNRE